MSAGKKGEDYVCRYLKKNGAEILCRNYSCRFGEIDIIAKKGDILIFTEVKMREENALVLPVEAVDIRKQQRILKAAQAYIKFSSCLLQPRFDVAAVTSKNGRPVLVEYYENAFSAKENYI